MKKNQIDSANFWQRKMTLKVRIVLFLTLNSENDWKTKKVFLAIFIVLWSCLFTTKLGCLQKDKFDHTIVCKGDKLSGDIIVRHMTYLQDIERCHCLSTFFLFIWCKFVLRYDNEHNIWEFVAFSFVSM